MQMTDGIAAFHDDSSLPLSTKLTTTEEFPAAASASLRNVASTTTSALEIVLDDPLSRESAEALDFDAAETIALDTPGKTETAPSGPTQSFNIPPAGPPVDEAAETALPTAAPPPPRSAIEYPRPLDVLMPVEGYQLWSGNARYLTLVASRQAEFLTANRSEQARVALEIVHTIQHEGGRFLISVDVPATETQTANSSIVRVTAWDLMKETDVLMQLGNALRTSEEEERKRLKKEEKRRRKEKKRRRKERRRARRRDRELAAASDEGEVSPSTMGPLQSLYYVPSYYPVADDRSKDSLKYESDSGSSSSTYGEGLPPPVSKKLRVVRKSTKSHPLAPAPDKKPAFAASFPIGAPPDLSTELRKDISFHYKPKSMKSQQAAFDKEGETNLPKGVTVRPSGKWVRWSKAPFFLTTNSRFVTLLTDPFRSTLMLSKPKPTLRGSRVTSASTIRVASRPAPMSSSKIICVNIAQAK